MADQSAVGGRQDGGEVGVCVSDRPGGKVDGVLGVEDGEAFIVGAAAGEEVADSRIQSGDACGFRTLGAFGVADVKFWGMSTRRAICIRISAGRQRRGERNEGTGWTVSGVLLVGSKGRLENGNAGLYLGDAAVEVR